MNRSERLGTVRRLNEQHELDAARALGHSVQILQQQAQRLQELERYREEYNQQFRAMGGGGVVAARLHEMRRFLSKLELAIKRQRQIVEEAERLREERRRTWRQANSKSQAMDRVVELYQQNERCQESRREQLESDDHAQSGSALPQTVTRSVVQKS